MKERMLAKIVRYLIYTTAFVPLIIFKDLISPFNFGKVVIFRSLVEILGVFYLILLFKDSSYLPRKVDKIFWALLIFVFLFALTTATSVWPYQSFWGTLERMGGLWTLLHYFIYYIILISVFRTKEQWQRLLDLTIFVGLISAFYGFGQKIGVDFFVGAGKDRIFGTIGNPAAFAGYQLLIVFLSLALLFSSDKTDGKRKLFLGSAVIFCSIALLMTAVRGAMLGLAAGLIVFAFLWFLTSRSAWAKRAVIFLLIFSALFLTFAFTFRSSEFVQKSRYLKRITNLSFNAVTVKTRFWAWEAGLKGWADYPKTMILGWGPENFNVPFSRHFNPKIFDGITSETFYDRAHNMFVEILVTMGLAGLGAYVFLFAVIFMHLIKFMRKQESAGLASGLIALISAYIIHNFFFFDLVSNFIVFFSVLGFSSFIPHLKVEVGKIAEGDRLLSAGFIGSGEKISAGNQSGLVKERLTLVLSAGLVIAVAFLIYQTNIKPAKANFAVSKAIARTKHGDFDGAIARFKEAISYNLPGKREFRHQLAQYLVGQGGPSLKEEKVKEAYLYTIDELKKSIGDSPVDYVPFLYVSRLNIILGSDKPNSMYNDEALKYLVKALELSPSFVRIYYEMGAAHLNKKDYPKAIASYQKAVDLNPVIGLSHWYLGLSMFEGGDEEGGMKHLYSAINRHSDYAYQASESDYLKLISFYLKKNDFEKIAFIYGRLGGLGTVELASKRAQYFSLQALFYAKIGRIDEAEKAARLAVETDQSFEPDARIFLQKLGRKW